ncbi:MAG: BamA/TamA family outer membrane protein [Candidatus Eiseniibacteriota bacterium]
MLGTSRLTNPLRPAASRHALVLAAVAMSLAAGTLPARAQSQAPSDTTQALVKREFVTTRHTSISAYPYAYYTPETELAFGAGGIVTFYTSEDRILRPSKSTVSAYYTTKKQYKFSLSPQLYFAQNTLFISSDLSYGYFVDKFWGLGGGTPETGDEGYTSHAFAFNANVQVRPLKHLLGNTRTGLVFDLKNTHISDKEQNVFLLADSVAGSNGGIYSGLGVNVVWDSRDDIFWPTKGVFSQGKVVFYGSALGSDFDYGKGEVDIRTYRALTAEKVLAFQIYLNSVGGGAPPFYTYPALGGQRTMRGYYEGRYRDKKYFATQAEYRSHLWKKIGYVAFIGVGNVTDRWGDQQLTDLKTSLGGGLRYRFSKTEKVNLRVDMGFGRSTNGVYFGLEEAF